MGKDVLIVNTHPGENPQFTDGLVAFLRGVKVEPQVLSGYETGNPLDTNPERVILTGVPLDVGYSLSQPQTQQEVECCFGWLRKYRKPVLGVCYGHQILAHIFGGKVDTLDEPVVDPSLFIEINQAEGLFSNIWGLKVFAEHSDYVSKTPAQFEIIAQKGGVPYIIAWRTRLMVGLQFVPERSGVNGKRILKRFVA